jgi:integrase
MDTTDPPVPPRPGLTVAELVAHYLPQAGQGVQPFGQQPCTAVAPPVAASESRATRQFGTIAELFTTYLERNKDRHCPRSFEEQCRLLNCFQAGVVVERIEDLIPDDLEGWIESNAQFRSDWTRRRIAATIKRPFNWAIRKGLLGTNPFAGVSYSPGQRGKAITEADFRAFLRGSQPDVRRVLLFLRWTGCRPCELSALTWSNVDAEAGAATLWIHKTSRTRKDREPRVIYLTAKAVRLLSWIRKHQRADDVFCFLNSIDRPWNRNSLTLRIYRLRKRLGLPMAAKLYGLRHAWATGMAEAGVDLKTLATLLGHTTVRMSEHYLHLSGNTRRLRETLEKASATQEEGGAA